MQANEDLAFSQAEHSQMSVLGVCVSVQLASRDLNARTAILV